MFILISVCEREILTEKFDDIESARKQMMCEIRSAVRDDDDISAEDWEAEEFEDYSIEVGWCKTSAYVSDGVNHDNYDWVIVEV